MSSATVSSLHLQMTLLCQLPPVTRRTQLLRRRRFWNSPPSCPRWIPSTCDLGDGAGTVTGEVDEAAPPRSPPAPPAARPPAPPPRGPLLCSAGPSRSAGLGPSPGAGLPCPCLAARGRGHSSILPPAAAAVARVCCFGGLGVPETVLRLVWDQRGPEDSGWPRGARAAESSADPPPPGGRAPAPAFGLLGLGPSPVAGPRPPPAQPPEGPRAEPPPPGSGAP